MFLVRAAAVGLLVRVHGGVVARMRWRRALRRVLLLLRLILLKLYLRIRRLVLLLRQARRSPRHAVRRQAVVRDRSASGPAVPEPSAARLAWSLRRRMLLLLTRRLVRRVLHGAGRGRSRTAVVRRRLGRNRLSGVDRLRVDAGASLGVLLVPPELSFVPRIIL